MNFFPTQGALGIDISEAAVRIAQLVPGRKQYQLKGWASSPIDPAAFHNGDLKQPELLQAALEQALARPDGGRLTARRAIISLPETQSFIKLLRIPEQTSDDDYIRLLKRELIRHVPLPLNELVWDWQRISGKEIDRPGEVHVLIAATPRITVEAFTEVFEAAGLRPSIFEIEAVAISRALLSPDALASTLVLDLGATRSSLIWWALGTIHFTLSVPLSGNTLTEALAHGTGMTWEEAELQKREHGTLWPNAPKGWDAIMAGFIRDLKNQITTAEEFFRAEFPDHPPLESIVVSGGQSALGGLIPRLQEGLQTPVTEGDPFAFIQKPKRGGERLARRAHSFTTAFGLSMRRLRMQETNKKY